MFRKTLPLLACLSVLAGSVHSLHMARDSYRRPSQQSDLDEIIDLSDENSLEPLPLDDAAAVAPIVVHRNHMPQPQHHPQQSVSPQRHHQTEFSTGEASNRQPPLSPLPHQETPIGLQELFGGTATLDIRLEQQKQRQEQLLEEEQQQQQLHQNKRAPTTGSGGGGAGSAISEKGGSDGGIASSNAKPILPPQVSHGIASQLMLRSARGQRNYDVPQIGEYLEYILSFSSV